jgi:hypothetical protein
MTSQVAEKLEMQGFRMTQNVSEISASAHIEFKCDIFSSTSQVSSFSAACSVMPNQPFLFSHSR